MQLTSSVQYPQPCGLVQKPFTPTAAWSQSAHGRAGRANFGKRPLHTQSWGLASECGPGGLGD